MPSRRLLGIVLGAAAYSLLCHWMMVQHTVAPWAVLLLLGPLLLAVGGMLLERLGRWGWLLLALLCGALVLLALEGGVLDVQRLYLLQHVGIHLLLASWFGGTLRSGRTPLISQLAARIHGGLEPAMARYTRGVTQVWTGYFLGMAAVSVAVYALLPFAAWAFFDNVLTPLLMAGLFVGEHVARYRLHPEFERVSVAAAVQAFRGVSGGRARP
ncbi:MAG: hypothetical protein V4505_06525 [Pseudomonadota bacterium]